MFVRFAAVLMALLTVSNSAFAAEFNPVKHKDGYWSVDVDGDSCVGSMMLQGGSAFLLRGYEGGVGLALHDDTGLPKGEILRLAVDSRTIDLPASFDEDGKTVYLDGVLDAPSLANLRGGRQMRVLIDGRAIAAMTLEGTGLPDVLDSLVACSRGKAGWWGKGVMTEDATPSAEPSTSTRYAYNAEDVWALIPSEEPGSCFAQAATDDKDRRLEFIQQGADFTIAVMSSGPALPRGLKGELVLDAGIFDFKPYYDDKTIMVMDGALTDEALRLLKATRGLTLRVDGKVLVDGNLEGTGFPKILDELAACARGEQGWWTTGAAPRAR